MNVRLFADMQKDVRRAGSGSLQANPCFSTQKTLAQMCKLNICASYFNKGRMPPGAVRLILAGKRLTISVIH